MSGVPLAAFHFGRSDEHRCQPEMGCPGVSTIERARVAARMDAGARPALPTTSRSSRAMAVVLQVYMRNKTTRSLGRLAAFDIALTDPSVEEFFDRVQPAAVTTEDVHVDIHLE